MTTHSERIAREQQLQSEGPADKLGTSFSNKGKSQADLLECVCTTVLNRLARHLALPRETWEM